MQSIILNVSLSELAFFTLGLLFYIRLIHNMRNFWLFLPHLLRAPVGILIYMKLPLSHDIVKSLDFDTLESSRNISFDEIHRRVKYNVEKKFFGVIQEQKKYFKCYAGLTVTCCILDFFNFVVVLHYFGKKGEEYQEIGLMLLTLLMLGTNVYWIGYIHLIQHKFPHYISKYIQEAFMSVGVLVEQKLEVWNGIAKNRAANVGVRAQRQASIAKEKLNSKMRKRDGQSQ